MQIPHKEKTKLLNGNRLTVITLFIFLFAVVIYANKYNNSENNIIWKKIYEGKFVQKINVFGVSSKV